MLYQFVYNWFSSQAFEIRNSRDSLIIRVLSKSKDEDPKTIELEAAIWIRLVENNEVTVPRRIVEHENKNSVYLKNLLMGSLLESV